MIKIFMHIPKTAGTSIRNNLIGSYKNSELLVFMPSNPYNRDTVCTELKSALSKVNISEIKVITGHFVYGIHEFLDNIEYKYVSIMRNPLNRIVSHYFHDLHRNIRENTGVYLLRHFDMVDYFSLQRNLLFYHNLQCRFLGGFYEEDLEHHGIDSVYDRCLSNISKDFELICNQENLSVYFIKLMNFLGVSSPEFLQDNTRGRLTYSDIFCPEEIEILSALNKHDIKLYEELFKIKTDNLPQKSNLYLTKKEHQCRTENAKTTILLSGYRHSLINLRESYEVLKASYQSLSRPETSPSDHIVVNSKIYTATNIRELTQLLNAQFTKRKFDIETMYNLCKQTILPDLIKTDRTINCLLRLTGTSTIEALYIINYLNLSLSYEGDVCEFGVAQGRTSALIADLMRMHNKKLWLYDSFEGLPEASDKDILIDDIYNLKDIKNYKGKLNVKENIVKTELHQLGIDTSTYKICKGWVEETLKAGVFPEKVCFAYLDMDFYQSTFDTLITLTNNLSVGGYFFIDDYRFFSSGIETAVNDWLAIYGKHFQIIEQNYGNFIIFKKIQAT